MPTHSHEDLGQILSGKYYLFQQDSAWVERLRQFLAQVAYYQKSPREQLQHRQHLHRRKALLDREVLQTQRKELVKAVAAGRLTPDEAASASVALRRQLQTCADYLTKDWFAEVR